MADNNVDVHRLQTAVDELRIINNLVNKICRVCETNHIMEIIITELVRLTGADQGIISLVSPLEDDDMVTVVRNNRPDSDSMPHSVGNLISGRVLTEGQMIRIDDLDTDERFKGLSSDDGRFKSIICCPMVVRDEAIGVTTLIRSAAKGRFGEDHARLVGILSSQSAHVLASAHLLEELARKNELLELSRKQLNEENARLLSEVGAGFAFENIIGKSATMKRVLTLTSKFAANDSPVLITGETGTGKELIARAIHFNSRRKGKPFVIKNCGVKTETLLESELFGHVKGAFTGADRTRIGLFKEADGGTIFLDEIGDAPLSTQMAVLRVIQSGEIRPVGATKTEFVDVRVISATNKNLADEIAEGRFREDLFYRLNTFVIDLPPLCRRRDDIALLVHHFIKKMRIKLDAENLAISPAAMEALSRFAWPGNIRQLENEIERAAVVSDPRGYIDVGDFSPALQTALGGPSPAGPNAGSLREAVERVECDLIRKTLAEYGGNILQTSKALGLTRKGLKDKMARYRIESGKAE